MFEESTGASVRTTEPHEGPPLTLGSPQVGGILYGAADEATCATLAAHHEDVQRRYGGNITRRRFMKPFEHGTMKAVGARVASGGSLGDNYDVYAHMHYRANHPEDFAMMFNHALARTQLLSV